MKSILAAISFLLMASLQLAVADDLPSITAEVPGLIVQSGDPPRIYAFPPAGFDANRPRGYWPYPYPPYPQSHPAFPPYPAYPFYSAPTPYVPLGSGYAAPAPEVRTIELKPGGRIVIEVQPEDAAVYVDALRLQPGTGNGYDIGVLAGTHRVDVRKPGLRAWGKEVEVPPGGGLLVTVRLEAESAPTNEGRQGGAP